MKKDDIRTLVVVVIICILCLLLVLLLNKKKNSDELEFVTEYNTFFAVVNCINEYIDYVSREDDNGIYNILSTEYINRHNIDKDNIYTNIDNYPENSSAKIDSMKIVRVGTNNIYYAKGKIIQNNYPSIDIINDNFNILVLIDYDNLTYSVYPLDDDNNERIINGIKRISIDKNDNNTLKGSGLVNNEQICVLYLSDYIDKINNDINSAYELLTTKMKERYPSIDSYQDYINSNKDIFTTVADKCRVTESEDNTRTYYVIDENENEYTFYENGVMNYTVEYYLK